MGRLSLERRRFNGARPRSSSSPARSFPSSSWLLHPLDSWLLW